MIGVYDSGSGGLCSLLRIRERYPSCDIIYRGDLRNAPYGVRSKNELLPIIEENLSRLRLCGCTHILVGCVTASSLLPSLSQDLLRGVYSIVDYVAKKSSLVTRNRRVGVISTTRTMKEGILAQALSSYGICVFPMATDALVPLAEKGHTAPDDQEVLSALREVHRMVHESDVDTLVLGCTHFSILKDAIQRCVGKDVTLILSGEVGADGFSEEIPNDVLFGEGHIHFI